MWKSRSVFRMGAFVGALIWAAYLGAPSLSLSQDPPFKPGETLTYDVTWSVFPAGQVNVMLREPADHSPQAYEVVTSARSQGAVSLLYKVRNEFHAFFDPRTTCSFEIHKKINEGRRHRETRIVFDATRRLAILDETDLNNPKATAKHDENEIPACVADVITAFYYVRRQPMKVGTPIVLAINDGSKTHVVTVEVQAREQIETPLGTQDAFRVEPKVFEGLYKRKGRMLIWFSDDERRLPLRIKTSIAVGTITGTLTSVTNAEETRSVAH